MFESVVGGQRLRSNKTLSNAYCFFNEGIEVQIMESSLSTNPLLLLWILQDISRVISGCLVQSYSGYAKPTHNVSNKNRMYNVYYILYITKIPSSRRERVKGRGSLASLTSVQEVLVLQADDSSRKYINHWKVKLQMLRALELCGKRFF